MADELEAICKMLSACGVTRVDTDYDGSGDDGTVMDARFISHDDLEFEGIILNKDNVLGQIREVVYNILSDQGFDWVNDQGGYGVVRLFPMRKSFTIEHNTRITNTEYSEYEGSL